MRRIYVMVSLGFLSSGVLYTPVAAQAGVPGGDGRRAEEFRAEYDARVLARIDSVLAGWQRLWRENRPERVGSLFYEEALLILPDGVPLLGSAEIELRMEELLPRVDEVRTGQSWFEASERLAFVVGAYELELAGDYGGGGTVAGRHVAVLMRRDDQWRIRSQIFFPGSEGPYLPDDGSVGGPLDPDHARRSLEDRGNWQEYYEETFERAGRTLGEIARAWREGEVGTATELYAEDAVLWGPEGEELQGREEIGRWLIRELPRTEEVHMAFLDFDASGRLAVLHGRYLLGRRGAGGGSVVGPYILLLRVDREPQIRAHILGRDPG